VALQMDPERRRKLAELARWHDEWQAKHQVDDADWVPEGADSELRRSPSLEAEREYWVKAGEIMGSDPWPPPPEKEQELRRKAREFLGLAPETGERGD
jgi:hypothetical protein